MNSLKLIEQTFQRIQALAALKTRLLKLQKNLHEHEALSVR